MSLSDTVGFIRELPHRLVDAFKATLVEAVEADLLLHVVDASSPAAAEQQEQVQRVLAEIGAADVPQILVFNKIDRLDVSQWPRAMHDEVETGSALRTPRVFVSAREGLGLAELRSLIAQALLAGRARVPSTPSDSRFEAAH